MVVNDGSKEEQILLKDVIDELKGELELFMDEHKSWPLYSKFFDNMGPLPHHIHHNDEKAALIGQKGKPETFTSATIKQPRPYLLTHFLAFHPAL